jgi:hypothetical protein
MKIGLIVGIMLSSFAFAQNKNQVAEGKTISYNIDFNKISKKYDILLPTGCSIKVDGILDISFIINNCSGSKDFKIAKSSGNEECDQAYLNFIETVCKKWNKDEFKSSGNECVDTTFSYTVKFKKSMTRN